jgi:hypothetical protein
MFLRLRKEIEHSIKTWIRKDLEKKYLLTYNSWYQQRNWPLSQSIARKLQNRKF